MRLTVYLALLAAYVASLGILHDRALPGAWTLVPIVVVPTLGILLWRYSRTEERESRRTYEASSAATYVALCGALVDLGYRITMRDPTLHTVHFAGGKLGPWIGRYGVTGSASVDGFADGDSEIVIAGRLDPADKHGTGWLAYPDGMTSRATRILDRVQATVVTNRMIDAGSHGAEQTDEGGAREPPRSRG